LTSASAEHPTPTRVDLTNLLLIKLLEKQGKQLRKLSEGKDNKDEQDGFYLFNKLANLHPYNHNGVDNSQASK